MIRIKYTFQAFQKDHFWLPIAITGLFMIIVIFIPEINKYNSARSFLGFILPLITGGLSSYALLQDDALELQFTTKQSMWKFIFERLGIILVVIVLTSSVFQTYIAMSGISLSPLGGLLQRQLVWLVPCITTLVLGCAASLLTKSSSGGFAFTGTLWITQLLLRGWFIRQPVWRNFLLFYGVMDPFGKPLVTNQITLTVISIILLALSHYLITKQERYI